MVSDKNIKYEETQTIPKRWLLLILIITFLIEVIEYLLEKEWRSFTEYLLAHWEILSFSIITFFFTHLSTIIVEGKVICNWKVFGYSIYNNKTIPINQISDYKVKEYSLLSYGLRYSKTNCSAVVARGGHLVTLISKNFRFSIGTQKPNKLLTVLKNQLHETP